MRRRIPGLLLILAFLAGCGGGGFQVPTPGEGAIAAAQRQIAAAPPLVQHARDPAAQRAMLVRVGTRVAAAAEPVCAAQRGAGCRFRVGYDPSDVINAYAAGAGDVAVTAGLLRAVDGDDELAAVIAHEFGHHIGNHIAGARTRTTLGALAGMVVGAYTGLGDLSSIGASVGRLAYSKADEREADYLSAYITARAGYDLERAAGIWAKLAGSANPRATAGLLDTHPAGPERLAAWREAQREIAASPGRLPQPASRR